MVLKVAKEIAHQREEYEFLMKNKELLTSFQLSTNLPNLHENVIMIELKANEENFEYVDKFEWDVTNPMKK